MINTVSHHIEGSAKGEILETSQRARALMLKVGRRLTPMMSKE